MNKEQSLGIIEQVTQHKLEYVRQLLEAAGIARSGTRSRVRERLVKAIESGSIPISSLQALLEELDAWGNQRLRIGRFPSEELAKFQSEDAVIQRVAEAGMTDLLEGEILLVPPKEIMPMAIQYSEKGDQRLLKLIAAKTRHVMLPVPDVPDYRDNELYPGVIFKPFKEETQKAISFAEIDLKTGLLILSTTLIRQGLGYKTEFGEFLDVFASIVPLDRAERIDLYKANQTISKLPQTEVRLVGRRARTSSGGSLESRSHSFRSDLRADVELDRVHAALPDAAGSHCNCYWEPGDGLFERVHTQIYAAEGEVTILGKIKEVSARYVLSRILQAN